MAEALLRMSGNGAWEVYSAGIEPGKEANPNAVEVMRELGCDLTGHRPKHVSDLQKNEFRKVRDLLAERVRRMVAT